MVGPKAGIATKERKEEERDWRFPIADCRLGTGLPGFETLTKPASFMLAATPSSSVRSGMFIARRSVKVAIKLR